MSAYYNEIDQFAAKWLEQLISAGHIAPGDVDTRSIVDVKPEELEKYTQCHFFAGIGVWSYALRQAGWSDDKPVWTGSCPCQPFSNAGKGGGFADERHLWPFWQWLIEQCKPATIFGEQVASKSTGPWFDLVQADLEGVGYAFGCVPFPSAGVGAPHIRDRAYWVANAEGEGWDWGQDSAKSPRGIGLEAGGLVDGVEDPKNERLQRRPIAGGNLEAGSGGLFLTGSSNDARETRDPGPTNGFWRNADWIGCRDDKFRPVEPGTFPLVDGTPNRVGRLRGYGNAINSEQAKIFIQSAAGNL